MNVLISISQNSKKETSKALMNFISGTRTKETNWCDWARGRAGKFANEDAV